MADAGRFPARMLVGPHDSPGDESFDVLVCTPAWLFRAVAQIGRVRLVVEKLAIDIAEAFLRRQIERLEAPIWEGLAVKKQQE